MMTCTKEIECYVEKVLIVISGKWAFLVINNLFDGTKRFGEIRKNLHNISPKTLTSCLRNLENNGIITREVIPTIPPAVNYTLTEKGEGLKPMIESMKLWGEKYLDCSLNSN